MMIPAVITTATPTQQATQTPTTAMPTTIQVISTIRVPVAVIASPDNAQSSCDNAAYVSDVTIEDGTEIYPDEVFAKTWELHNDGTCTWDEDYSLTFVSGTQMDGNDIAIESEVEPGENLEITVEMTAPSTELTYTGYWRMMNAEGTLFGDTIYVNIVVTEDAATSTPTEEEEATSTPEPTDTPEATSTPTEATETSVPEA